MGIGFALGGIAKGISDQQELGIKNNALKLQTAEMQSNNSYRNAMLGLEQQRVKASSGLEAATQARQIYDGLYNNVKDIIAKAQAAGTPVDKITEAIQPQLAYMQSLAPVAGIDTSAAAGEISGLLKTGTQATGPRVGQAWEGVQAKIAAGIPLTPGEEQLKQLKISEMKALMAGGGAGVGGGDLPTDEMSPSAPAPAAPAPAAPAPAAAAPAAMAPSVTAPASASTAPAEPAHPPVPPSLIGKAIAWSDKTQRFYDKAGNAYNQQGVPVPQ